jgi:hypothetical protein
MLDAKNGPIGLVMLAVGVAVVIHGDMAERFCVAHPLSLSCDNVMAPGPDHPHGPEPINGPTWPRAVTQVSLTGTVTGPVGMIMR